MANGHPTWCETDENGVHRSRLWPTSRPGDRPVEVHAFLWASGPLLGVGLDFTTEGERDTYHLLLKWSELQEHPERRQPVLIAQIAGHAEISAVPQVAKETGNCRREKGNGNQVAEVGHGN